ncbi:MAG TPA: hypothetical protein VN894_06135 [Polyangiaceae bacterium]|nr:hypothetical protein [Polyangiaceae bacterium]
MSAQPWQEAFLAVSLVLGEPLEESLSAIGEGATLRAPLLLRGLRSSSREVRAHAIARAVAPVAVALDEMRLR